MKPKHQRMVFVGVSVVLLCAAVLLVLRAFSENIVFFYSPSELVQAHPPSDRQLRVGGLVENGSVVSAPGEPLSFTITDGDAQVRVRYSGVLPALFREGQGVVAEGVWNGDIITAERILTKHDEKYMPREVVDTLKKTGRWQEGAAP